MTSIRTGTGFDAHRFCEGRELILAGVKIENKFGLMGHSDADVLAHSLIDALLGAAGMPDIGQLFPDTAAEYLNADSMFLLKKVSLMLKEKRIKVVNTDSVIICETPKIAPHTEQMKKNILQTLGLKDVSRVNLRGKTTEGMGFTGRGEGIAVISVALVEYYQGFIFSRKAE